MSVGVALLIAVVLFMLEIQGKALATVQNDGLVKYALFSLLIIGEYFIKVLMFELLALAVFFILSGIILLVHWQKTGDSRLLYDFRDGVEDLDFVFLIGLLKQCLLGQGASSAQSEEEAEAEKKRLELNEEETKGKEIGDLKHDLEKLKMQALIAEEKAKVKAFQDVGMDKDVVEEFKKGLAAKVELIRAGEVTLNDALASIESDPTILDERKALYRELLEDEYKKRLDETV